MKSLLRPSALLYKQTVLRQRFYVFCLRPLLTFKKVERHVLHPKTWLIPCRPEASQRLDYSFDAPRANGITDNPANVINSLSPETLR